MYHIAIGMGLVERQGQGEAGSVKMSKEEGKGKIPFLCPSEREENREMKIQCLIHRVAPCCERMDCVDDIYYHQI